ncbi:MAG: hypothetical protein KGJ01_03020, partial [Patescibacteria group bacterium]|nr:hypothetical protein [Patescibacteria group bacterium]
PTLPADWSYQCVSTTTLRNSNGTGWIPVDFQSVSFGTPIPELPIDPVNSTSTGEYYTYSVNGSKQWELTAEMEANKNRGPGTVAGNDGGENSFMYEVGSNVNLIDPTALNRGQGIVIDGVKYHIVAEGDSAVGYGPSTHGLFDSNWNQLFGSGRSYNTSIVNTLSGSVVGTSTIYDVYGNPSVANPALVTQLDSLTNTQEILIYSFDEPQANRVSYGLGTAMYGTGATTNIFGSVNFKRRSAYILIAQPGKGVYLEEYKGSIDNDTNAWISL